MKYSIMDRGFFQEKFLEGDVIMLELIIAMLKKADERKLRLVYVHVRALMGGGSDGK